MKEWNELRSRARVTRAQYRECGWHTWVKLAPTRELVECGAIPGRDGLMCDCGEPVRIEVVPISKCFLTAAHAETFRLKCTHPRCGKWLMVQYNDYEQSMFATVPGGIMEDMRRKWRREVRG